MRMSILTKVLVPVLGLLAASCLLGLWALNSIVAGMVDKEVSTATTMIETLVAEEARRRLKTLENDVQRVSGKALEIAASFTKNADVLEAYRLAHGGNINNEADPQVQQARVMLRTALRPLLVNYGVVTGKRTLQLHYHLPNGRSFSRAWLEGHNVVRDGKKLDVSDDISGFRQTVVAINQGSHTPIAGIEVGVSGFVLRGLAPIADTDGKHLGSNEVLLPFAAVLTMAKNEEAEVDFTAYMTKELLSVATQLRDPAKNPVQGDRFVLVDSTNAKQGEAKVDLELLAKGLQGYHDKIQGDRYDAVMPIKDFNGAVGGVLLMTRDISAAKAKIAAGQKEGQATLARVQRLSMLSMGGVLALLSVILLYVTWRVTKPIGEAVRVTEAISRGDLSQRLTTVDNDEIGDLAGSLNRMVESLEGKASQAGRIADGDFTVEVPLASEADVLGQALRKMVAELGRLVGDIQDAGRQIAQGASQVSDFSQDLSHGATESASSLEEISASMNELATQTRQNAEIALQANDIARKARESGDRGGERMQDMVRAMEEINQAGQNISKIIKVIDEIAFQTNLLALNAAVEAARAGQHGKGFAVVAEEVRNLAARSAKAAGETADLIASSVQKAESGMGIARRTLTALDEIVGEVGQVSDLLGEIAKASNEQAEGIGQINLAIGQIDKVTQQNTATAEESAAAAEELSGQSEQLRQMLQRFRVRGGADGSGRGRQEAQRRLTALAMAERKSDESWG